MRRRAASVTALLFATLVSCQTPDAAPTPTVAPPSPTATLASEQARREHFEKVWSTVKENYYHPDLGGVDWVRARAEFEPQIVSARTDEEYRTAIAAMVERLGDDHSSYLTPAQARVEDAGMTGAARYGGIGFIGRWSDGLYVQTVFTDDPADRAGLRRRDRILAIDDKAPADAPTALQSIRGAEGTKVRLTVRSPGEAPRQLTVIRAQVQGRARPEARRLASDPRIGYVFVPSFTVADMGRLAHQELDKIVAPDLAGLVVDLRGNPGGESVAVLEFLGAFVQGDVLTLVGAKEREVLAVRERPLFARLAGLPITVLVDRSTASFAESTAAVLQALRNAPVVGEATEGNTETIRPFNFPDGSRLWVATAIARLSSGAVIERVVPDVRVDGGWIDYVERNDPYLLRALAVLKGTTR